MMVLVDKGDNVLGLETRKKCHERDGILHRAFVIFIFNDKNQLLIQKRSEFKELWPLYWDNTCSGHPWENEKYEQAGERRLKEEFGFSCGLKLLFKFQYHARYKDMGSENELCAVLIGNHNDIVNPNLQEIAEWKWIDLKKLKSGMDENPDEYTPWFKIVMDRIITERGSFY